MILSISSNDSSIFNYFPNSNKFLWMHNPLQIEKSIRKKQFFSILKNKPTVIFVSDYLNNITSKMYPFKTRHMIPNFLSSDFIIKVPPIKREPIFVWSVQRSKGLADTIKMWIEKIYPTSKKAKFYILGMNKLDQKYNIKFLKSKNIIFLGRLPKNKLKEIYMKSTAMICLGYDETFCLIDSAILSFDYVWMIVITFLLGLFILVKNFKQLLFKSYFFIKLKHSKKKDFYKRLIGSFKNLLAKQYYLPLVKIIEIIFLCSKGILLLYLNIFLF